MTHGQDNESMARGARLLPTDNSMAATNARPAETPAPEPGLPPAPQAQLERAQKDDESGCPPINDELEVAGPLGGGGWTIPMLCAGLAIIASCWLLPMAEANHQLVYELERLKLDLRQVKEQVVVNDEFLRRVAVDSTLAQRLAQRQMKLISKGMSVLNLDSNTPEEVSPFTMVSLPPAAALPPYRPLGGWLAHICLAPKLRLLLSGLGMLLVAAGLVLSRSGGAGTIGD